MGRRRAIFLVSLLVMLASGFGAGFPATALADTTYLFCPSFTTLKTDVEAFSGAGTITFRSKNCSLRADTTITTQDNSDVTINGNGLMISGGTAATPGGFDLIDVGLGGSLTLDRTTLEYGHVGIHAFYGGIITLTSSSVSGNGADGIDQTNGIITLTDSTVSDNHAQGIRQGNAGEWDLATLINSTISSNGQAGISQGYGTTTLIDSTISDNGSDGIVQGIGDATLTNATISANSGSGISQGSSTDSITMTASLLADNSFANCAVGSMSDQAYNLSDDASCAFFATGSQNSVGDADLHLGTLGEYGGPTQTIPLLPGSVAVDAIPLSSGACSVGATTDQRGIARPQGSGCDIGAYELAASTPSATLSILNGFPIRILAYLVTGPAGIQPIGFLSYHDPNVQLSQVQPLSLVVDGSQATVTGTAQLADGTPVGFTLDARSEYPNSTIRLQLSNGYDSGDQRAYFVRIRAAP